MITSNEVMPLLLEACPSFLPMWHAVEAENRNEENVGGRLHYIDAGKFIRHLVALRIANRTDEFPDALAVMSGW